MTPDPSVTLDIETAITVGSWLHRMSEHESLEPAVAEPLAGLAAAIGRPIRNQAVSEDAPYELSIMTAIQSTSPSHSRSDTRGPRADRPEPLDECEDPHAGRGDEAEPAQPSDRAPSQVYGELPEQAWDASPARGDANPDRDHTESAGHDSQSPAGSGGESWESGSTPPSQFVTAYECEVCSGVHEMEASVKVCAYVADCPVCGAVDARFTAIEIPTPVSGDSRHS